MLYRNLHVWNHSGKCEDIDGVGGKGGVEDEHTTENTKAVEAARALP